MHALLFVIDGQPVAEVAALLDLNAQTVRDDVNHYCETLGTEA